MEQEPEKINIPNEYLIDRLQLITQRLETMASICFGGLLIMLFCLALMVLISIGLFNKYAAPQFTIFACITLVCNLFSLYRFERLSKSGDSLFNEISDEFQWKISSESAYHQPNDKGRPSFNIRLSLRNFVKSSDLPLSPGKSGITLYLLLNILIWALALILGITLSRI